MYINIYFKTFVQLEEGDLLGTYYQENIFCERNMYTIINFSRLNIVNYIIYMLRYQSDYSYHMYKLHAHLYSLHILI